MAAERRGCELFKLQWSKIEHVVEEDASIVAQAFKGRKTVKQLMDEDVALIPPTSNECEGLLSASKLVHSDLRQSMDASTLEMVMFLVCNRDMWDEKIGANSSKELNHLFLFFVLRQLICD